MSKHTPGPWHLIEHESEPCELMGGSVHIADIFATDFPQAQLDARLIAAAPELIEAVKFALRDVLSRQYTLSVHDIEQLLILKQQEKRYREAIEKAEGRE
jgi:hypothetical protein